MAKVSPFDISANINKKTGLYNGFEPSDYDVFVTNLIYSKTQDTLFIANEANKVRWLPQLIEKEMMYEFYYHIVPFSARRYGKWHKKPNDNKNLIEAIMIVYDYSEKKAKDVVDLFTAEQAKELLAMTFKGGRKK